MPECNGPDRPHIGRYAELTQEGVLIREDPKEQRAKTVVDSCLEDDHGGHAGVDVPVRDWPGIGGVAEASVTLVGLRVPRKICALISHWQDQYGSVQQTGPGETRSLLFGKRAIPEPSSLCFAFENDEIDPLAEPRRGHPAAEIENAIDKRRFDWMWPKVSDHPTGSNDLFKLHVYVLLYVDELHVEDNRVGRKNWPVAFLSEGLRWR